MLSCPYACAQHVQVSHHGLLMQVIMLLHVCTSQTSKASSELLIAWLTGINPLDVITKMREMQEKLKVCTP